jgi:hypothetical protein
MTRIRGRLFLLYDVAASFPRAEYHAGTPQIPFIEGRLFYSNGAGACLWLARGERACRYAAASGGNVCGFGN